jgi:hypothetical protein
MERGALKAHENLDQLFGFLDCWRRANAERERNQALLGGDWFGLRKRRPDKSLLGKDGGGLRSSRMCGHADRTFGRIVRARVVMRNRGHR